MDDQGVTDSNVAFYLGTHAHSDHIGNANEIIRRYRPKLIFSPEYSDQWITDENGLWDNQYVYDHLVEAAQWARSEYGAQFIQELDGYSTHVRMGDMDVQMIPFDVDEVYKRQGTTDANLMGWGAKVSAFGRSAFLAADLMDTDSDWTTHNGFEGRIASEVGGVDILKAGHHGQESSNFEEFLGALAPSTIIQTGLAEDTPDRLTRHAVHGDGLWFPMGDPGRAGGAPGPETSVPPTAPGGPDPPGARKIGAHRPPKLEGSCLRGCSLESLKNPWTRRP